MIKSSELFTKMAKFMVNHAELDIIWTLNNWDMFHINSETFCWISWTWRTVPLQKTSHFKVLRTDWEYDFSKFFFTVPYKITKFWVKQGNSIEIALKIYF